MDVFVKDGDEFKPLPDDYKVLSNSDLDSQYVSVTKHNEGVQSAIADRFKNHLNKDKAHEDATVIARVLESQDVGKGVDLDAQRKQWATAHLTPVQEELKDKTEKLNAIAGQLKYAQMREVLGKDFGPALTDRVEADKPSLAEILLGDRLDFDLNTSTLKVKDSAMSVLDFSSEIKQDPRYTPYLKAPEKTTSGHGRPGQSGPGATGRPSVSKKDDIEGGHSDYIRAYGLNKPKVEGVPAYNQLK